MVKCQVLKVKYQQKDLIIKDINVKHQSSSTNYSIVIRIITVFKMVKNQGHWLKNVGINGKTSTNIHVKWKTRDPTVQKFLTR